MDIEDGVNEDLKNATREALEDDILDSSREPEMPVKNGDKDEKIERQALSKTEGSLSPQQLEFLVRQRTDMSNDELQKFLAGEHEVLEDERDWKPFSRTEERFLLQNADASSVEEIAKSIDRDPEEVKLQLRIMGLNSLE